MEVVLVAVTAGEVVVSLLATSTEVVFKFVSTEVVFVSTKVVFTEVVFTEVVFKDVVMLVPCAVVKATVANRANSIRLRPTIVFGCSLTDWYPAVIYAAAQDWTSYGV